MRVFAVALCLVLCLSSAWALPVSLEQFQARVATEACSPQGAARLWFDAVFVYLQGDTRLGIQLITAMMKDKQWASSTPVLTETMKLRPHVLRSYAKGATPESGYTINPDNYELNIRDLSLQPFKQFPEGKIVRLLLQSGGADAPRNLDLERNGLGLYAVREAGPLCVNIRPPATNH